jgi:hypothetical protein
MDFFEQWFGWSPDGGNGTTEIFYIGLVVAVVVTFIARAYYKRRRAGSQPYRRR